MRKESVYREKEEGYAGRKRKKRGRNRKLGKDIEGDKKEEEFQEGKEEEHM